ncbi:Aste57867_24953 [Aphanomyces stellatus]|uniref:Aste57867_24953 protein n=1 Tax=Aphanomyces stellatus TaxID=120398 RepID=A0A485LSQ6_9STRA|nr:hypothetical protein As57867_024875 [Aphanomyces stellatus]VFU01584.1 Aste57867_24953 [Aphanomyces stellatus]
MDMSDDTIHRPLLFDTKGYASSEMLLDDAYRKSRQRSLVEEVDVSGHAASHSNNPMLQGPLAPRLRLETLTSWAASAVLLLTYVAFAVALALPYLHTLGYLSQSQKLSGELCSVTTSQNACTYIDLHGPNAWWSANVSNVSWLAGSMSLAVEPLHANISSDKSIVLEYDIYVYGGHLPLAQLQRTNWIFARFNQSVWLHCPAGVCGKTTLFDISQDNEGLGGNGYGSYLIVVVYHGYYPHSFAPAVDYFFSFAEPAMYVSELILRTALLVFTLVYLPWWVYYAAATSSAPVLPIQKCILGLGLVLLVYQNPVFTVAQWYRSVEDSTRFASGLCQAVASALLRTTWLFVMDHPLSADAAWRKALFGLVDIAIHASLCVLRFPRLFGIAQHEVVYVLLGLATEVVTWFWLVWILRICRRTTATLKQLIYMISRDQQLSYRFLFLELILVVLYVAIASLVQVSLLVRTWAVDGTSSFVQAAVAAYSTGAAPVERVLFTSVLVYLTMAVHLPPTQSFLGSTSFYIEEGHRHVARRHPLSDLPSRRDDHVFCLETAEWLVQIAWQAYLDPLGNPSASGSGVQTLELFGFELIVHLRHELLDTQAIVCMHRTKKRLVVAFRGSVSKAHWKTNLRFHQVPLLIHSMQGFKRSTANSCKERAMRWASKIPLLNLALPRVHSGFWKAYGAVRGDLKETLRFLLDDDPDLTVYMTGHSMGGALAVLAAYDCAVHFNIDITMYNFGGPRVGNPAFMRQYNRAVPNSHRVVLDGDLVAGIPRFWGLYQHVGTEVAIDEEGNLIVDPSFIERRLHQRSKTRVAVHGMMVYRSMLRKCFDNLQV